MQSHGLVEHKSISKSVGECERNILKIKSLFSCKIILKRISSVLFFNENNLPTPLVNPVANMASNFKNIWMQISLLGLPPPPRPHVGSDPMA
jgi:hypothetical protein